MNPMPDFTYPPTFVYKSHAHNTDNANKASQNIRVDATADVNSLNILQLTDLHLHADDTVIEGIAVNQSFEKCLTHALTSGVRCDLILLTGDLVSDIDTGIYDRLFTRLKKTGIPFACMAGNHDVTQEIGHHLPFEQRTFKPHAPDSRLLHQHVIESEHWQLLLIDSSKAGKVGGEITQQTITWVNKQLGKNGKYALLAMHHHIMTMYSQWIDKQLSKGADKLWQVLHQHSHCRCVINGHVHQDLSYLHDGILILATPATCYQFKAFSQDFAYDSNLSAGYRWIFLHDDGQITSRVQRVNQ